LRGGNDKEIEGFGNTSDDGVPVGVGLRGGNDREIEGSGNTNDDGVGVGRLRAGRVLELE